MKTIERALHPSSAFTRHIRLVPETAEPILQGDYYALREAIRNGQISLGDEFNIRYHSGQNRVELPEKKGVCYVGVSEIEGYVFTSPADPNNTPLLFSTNIISFQKTAEATKKSREAAKKTKATLRKAQDRL